jgi:hypothetical protein
MEKENNGKGATTADVFWLCNLISNRTQLMASNGERFALKSRVYTGRIMVDLVCVYKGKTIEGKEKKKWRARQQQQRWPQVHRLRIFGASPAE